MLFHSVCWPGVQHCWADYGNAQSYGIAWTGAQDCSHDGQSGPSEFPRKLTVPRRCSLAELFLNCKCKNQKRIPCPVGMLSKVTVSQHFCPHCSWVPIVCVWWASLPRISNQPPFGYSVLSCPSEATRLTESVLSVFVLVAAWKHLMKCKISLWKFQLLMFKEENFF